MNKLSACATVFGLALVANAANGDAPVPGVIRTTHDVACNLTVKSGAAGRTGSGVSTKLVVKNKSRVREPNVQVAIFANAPVGTPIWTGTLDLKGHHQRTKNLHIDVPAGTTSLIAVATSESDDNPGNNISGAELSTGSGGGDGGDNESGDDGEGGGTTGGGTTGGTTVPPAANAAVMAGAATYSSNCASCHGADAKGTRSGPRVLGRSAGDVYGAMREGEDGMPRFMSLTATDAKNIAAFLANPAAATQPSTPITLPAPGASVTYTGQIATLLQANCVVCHTGKSASGSAASGPIQLDSYANASKNAAAALAAMSSGIMPAGNPLPASSVQLFSDWIAGGKKQ